MKKLVWICWKDIHHPEAGGAELVTHEISKRLVGDGWEVIHLVPGFNDCSPTELIDGVRVIRIGHSILAFYRLPFYYWKHLRATTTVLVDSFISVGSFACLTMKPDRAALIIYHIEDVKWFTQTRVYGVPRWIMPLINVSGYFVEKLQLMLLAVFFQGRVLTISESTAKELVHHGFKRDKISLITMGATCKPLMNLSDSLAKEPSFTVLLLGPRKGKRPLHTVKAFEILSRQHPDVHLWVAGWGNEGELVRRYVEKKDIRNVRFWGRVSDAQRDELMQKAHILCTSPIREGWGLVVIEANAMGTPVIAYDVPGLRDALAFNNGWLSVSTPQGMADRLEEALNLWLCRRTEYDALRQRCLYCARVFSFEKTYDDYNNALGI
ncbi:MAG: glycosyltransferase family 4 protein [bacterium]